MDEPKDYYRILGVPRDASAAAIRSAYQRLTRRRRPGGRPQAPAAALHDVQQAYEVLSDAERRRLYDASLREPECDRYAALAWPTSARPGVSTLRRPTRPVTISADILLSPREAHAGGALTLALPLPGPCPACQRTGGYLLACPRCGGEGRIERREAVVVRVPAGVRDGALFQVHLDAPDVQAILLTVHITRAR